MTQNLMLTALSLNDLQEAMSNALAQQNALPEAKPEKSYDMPKLLSIADLCEYFNVSRVTIHSWMKKGRLPFRKVSRRVYFVVDEVIESMQKFDLSSTTDFRKSLMGARNGK